jgi:hypothetical protein
MCKGTRKIELVRGIKGHVVDKRAFVVPTGIEPVSKV